MTIKYIALIMQLIKDYKTKDLLINCTLKCFFRALCGWPKLTSIKPVRLTGLKWSDSVRSIFLPLGCHWLRQALLNSLTTSSPLTWREASRPPQVTCWHTHTHTHTYTYAQALPPSLYGNVFWSWHCDAVVIKCELYLQYAACWHLKKHQSICTWEWQLFKMANHVWCCDMYVLHLKFWKSARSSENLIQEKVLGEKM